MTRRVGIGAHIGWAEESTYGTAVAVANHLPLQDGDESLTHELDRLESAAMATRGVDVDDVAKGAYRVAGTWGHDLRIGGGSLLLLEHLVGNRFVTTGTTNYNHALSVGANNTALAGKGLTMVVDRDGLLASSDNAYQFTGVRPTSWDFSQELGAFARSEWNLLGKAGAFVAQPTPTFPTDEYVKSPSDAAAPTATVKFGTDASEVAFSARSVKVKIAQVWESIYDLANPGMLEPALGGLIEVTFELVTLYKGSSTAGDAWTSAYRAQTPKSLLLNFDGSTATTKGLWFDMPNVLLTAPPEVHQDSKGALWQTIAGKAFRDGATMECAITLKNQDSTIAS